MKAKELLKVMSSMSDTRTSYFRSVIDRQFISDIEDNVQQEDVTRCLLACALYRLTETPKSKPLPKNCFQLI